MGLKDDILLQRMGISINFNNNEVIEQSEVTILAVKPQVMSEVLNQIKDYVTPKNLILSVAMGVTIKQLESTLPSGSRIVRVMPNVPALVMQGASVYSPGTKATQNDANIAEQLFGSVGTCHKVPEHLFDAVTALSGSGPAYICTVIEGMADGAVSVGMPRDLAYKLAAQTALGTAALILNDNVHPAVLKDNVSSPAGSTCEGLFSLEQGAVRAAFISAIRAATSRCKEMSKSAA